MDAESAVGVAFIALPTRSRMDAFEERVAVVTTDRPTNGTVNPGKRMGSSFLGRRRLGAVA